MNREPTVWVVGSTMVDMIAYAERIPERGETLVGRDFTLGFGGKGANQAVMARRLGARVAIVNCLGEDVFAEMTIENFDREGIDVTHVHRTDAAASGVAPIWVEPDGANRIIVVPGANEHLDPADATRAIREAESVDVVVGQLEIRQEVTAAAFAAARARGAVTVLNPAPAAALLPALLEHTDWLVPNEIEFAQIAADLGLDARDLLADAGALMGRVSDRLVVRIAVTLGERGAALLSADGVAVEIPAEAVDAVDTTGAGDAFVGAFAYALGCGLAEQTAVQLGCACATASVRRKGTQTSFPRGEEAERLVAAL